MHAHKSSSFATSILRKPLSVDDSASSILRSPYHYIYAYQPSPTNNAPPPPPPPCTSSASNAVGDNDMLTFEQKDLSEAIQTLDGQKLERVIQIIHEGVLEIQNVRPLSSRTPMPITDILQSTEETELEINLPLANVLTKLYNFVIRPLKAAQLKRVCTLCHHALAAGVGISSPRHHIRTRKSSLFTATSPTYTSSESIVSPRTYIQVLTISPTTSYLYQQQHLTHITNDTSPILPTMSHHHITMYTHASPLQLLPWHYT